MKSSRQELNTNRIAIEILCQMKTKPQIDKVMPLSMRLKKGCQKEADMLRSGYEGFVVKKGENSNNKKSQTTYSQARGGGGGWWSRGGQNPHQNQKIGIS